MRKGMEILNIAMIAFIGILVVMFWVISQQGAGSGYVQNIIGQSPTDEAKATLETAKRTIAEGNIFSSHTAALETAAAGGTLAGERFWWCNGQPTPPSAEEVTFAMSNRTLSKFNIYVNETQNQIEGMNVTLYNCVGVFNPGKKNCPPKNSENCEYWNTSSIGGQISVERNKTTVQYASAVEKEVVNNRFWWMYWVLKKTADENKLMQWIVESFQDQCTGPEDDAAKMDIAIKIAIEKLEAQFDQYVNCTFEYECGPNTTMECVNYDCTPEPFTEKLCFEIPEELLSADRSYSSYGDIVQLKPGDLNLQMASSARIKIECIDSKYEIPSEMGTEKLRWVIKAALTGGGECRPVDEVHI